MTTSTNFPPATRIAVNGIELEVHEAGRENAGNPIVLCHGWPEHAFAWRHQIPALAAAGFHVIVPNQRGFGGSSCPPEVSAYDITNLTGDLVGLLDHFGYAKATFVGHDWGANIVWALAILHPDRVDRVINLALPYQARTEVPWIEFMEAVFGADHYFVHFNRQPGVADAVLDANTERFLRNLYRENLPPTPPGPGMVMIDLATSDEPQGDPLLDDEELAVLTAAFETSGFRGGIHWYRNLDRNWKLLEDVDPIVRQAALMIYGARDPIPPSDTLTHFVPKVDVRTLDCGHWIQQERPEETTRAMLDWLAANPVT